MKATEFKSVLTRLSNLLRVSGAKQAANDVDLLTDRLASGNALSAEQAISKLDVELDRQISPAQSTSRSTEWYIRAFIDAGLDENAFDKVYAEFSVDKSVSKAAAIAVLKGYAGQHASARSKTDALDEIQRRFSQLLYSANTERQAATTPW